jgi:hypothetical protein
MSEQQKSPSPLKEILSSSKENTTDQPKDADGAKLSRKNSVKSTRSDKTATGIGKSRNPSSSPKNLESKSKSPTSKPGSSKSTGSKVSTSKSPSKSPSQRKKSSVKQQLDDRDNKLDSPIPEIKEDVEITHETTEYQPVVSQVNLVDYIKNIIKLSELNDELWTDEHRSTVNEFLTRSDKRLLICYLDSLGFDDGKNHLFVKTEMPNHTVEQFAYFFKYYYNEEITTTELFHKNVQYGNFNGKTLKTLLRLTSGLYAPLFFGNNSWPDSKFEFKFRYY